MCVCLFLKKKKNLPHLPLKATMAFEWSCDVFLCAFILEPIFPLPCVCLFLKKKKKDFYNDDFFFLSNKKSWFKILVEFRSWKFQALSPKLKFYREKKYIYKFFQHYYKIIQSFNITLHTIVISPWQPSPSQLPPLPPYHNALTNTPSPSLPQTLHHFQNLDIIYQCDKSLAYQYPYHCWNYHTA